jgi:hypothetical protein
MVRQWHRNVTRESENKAGSLIIEQKNKGVLYSAGEHAKQVSKETTSGHHIVISGACVLLVTVLLQMAVCRQAYSFGIKQLHYAPTLTNNRQLFGWSTNTRMCRNLEVRWAYYGHKMSKILNPFTSHRPLNTDPQYPVPHDKHASESAAIYLPHLNEHGGHRVRLLSSRL